MHHYKQSSDIKQYTAYLSYLKNIMEATLRKDLGPVNAVEDKAESLFERSEFDEAPEQVYRLLVLELQRLE